MSVVGIECEFTCHENIVRYQRGLDIERIVGVPPTVCPVFVTDQLVRRTDESPVLHWMVH